MHQVVIQEIIDNSSLLMNMVLLQKNKKDVLNFDAEFTREDPILTPVNIEVLRSINQEEFKGFSFLNKDFNPARFVAD